MTSPMHRTTEAGVRNLLRDVPFGLLGALRAEQTRLVLTSETRPRTFSRFAFSVYLTQLRGSPRAPSVRGRRRDCLRG